MNRHRLFQIEIKLRKEGIHPFLWPFYPETSENLSPRAWANAFKTCDRLVWISSLYSRIRGTKPLKVRVLSDSHFDSRWRFQLLYELRKIDPTLDSELPSIPIQLKPENIGTVIEEFKALQRRSLWLRIVFFPHRSLWGGIKCIQWLIFSFPVFLYKIHLLALVAYLFMLVTIGYIPFVYLLIFLANIFAS